MAIADPGKHMPLLHGEFRLPDTGAALEINVVDNDDVVIYAYNQLKKKLPAIKRRFRAESSYRLSNSDKRRPNNTTFPSIVSELYSRNAAHIPISYYVFLFRLTPF
ncbi:hypothetical protein FAM09_03535 [Niastella caeni]|uniref:Uncharacterized protein n=1 Tax=Niastella caeni TaxID=2569763 RepID=A0A4S8HZM1_9BACT|nr:hypothetical protein [Niastella caeni]THU41197.1 hypothetical protein FAM09_03535 [Niastella caeni]